MLQARTVAPAAPEKIIGRRTWPRPFPRPPLERLGAGLLTLTIPSGSRLHGVTMFELRLPAPTVVTLIIPRGRAVIPDRETVLLRGDELLIVTTTPVREATERRPRAVSRRGRLVPIHLRRRLWW